MKMRRARRGEYPQSGTQVAFGQAAVGAMGLGALAVGATAVGALAIGALAIRALAVKRGKIERLNIEELEVGRLRVRELVVEQERSSSRCSGQAQHNGRLLHPYIVSKCNGSLSFPATLGQEPKVELALV
jgi:hypothetical protein